MPESTRKALEREEDARLAPYALRSADATRRLPLEDDGRAFDYRLAYQRDRDRVVYSARSGGSGRRRSRASCPRTRITGATG